MLIPLQEITAKLAEIESQRSSMADTSADAAKLDRDREALDSKLGDIQSKLAEMEFYLVDDLECDLTVFHPYRTLLTLCKKEGGGSDSSAAPNEAEAGELGVGGNDEEGPRYWGTGEGQLELSDSALQMAWYGSHTMLRRQTGFLIFIYPGSL